MIELKEFTKKFGDVTAVDAVSFQVEPGSIFGLVGSNGAANPPSCAASAASTNRTAARCSWMGKRPMRTQP